MWINLLLAGLGVILVGLAATRAITRARSERTVTQLVDDLPDAASLPDDLADLPPPVQRSLRHVLRDGQPLVETVRIEQSGTFRGEVTGDWQPFTATQHVTTRPSGFLWDAYIRMMLVLTVRVLDENEPDRVRRPPCHSPLPPTGPEDTRPAPLGPITYTEIEEMLIIDAESSLTEIPDRSVNIRRNEKRFQQSK